MASDTLHHAPGKERDFLEVAGVLDQRHKTRFLRGFDHQDRKARAQQKAQLGNFVALAARPATGLSIRLSIRLRIDLCAVHCLRIFLVLRACQIVGQPLAGRNRFDENGRSGATSAIGC